MNGPRLSPGTDHLNFFSENVDAWGAAEWFNRMATALRQQDAAVLANDDAALEICRNVAASSAMRLVRDYEQQVRSALNGVAQQPPSAFLWCCHVRGPDDVYAAPDYETALAWSDMLNEMNWRSGTYPKPSGFQDPASYADCLVKATPAPWPYSAEAHAKDLPKSIAGFAPPSNQGASK